MIIIIQNGESDMFNQKKKNSMSDQMLLIFWVVNMFHMGYNFRG